MVRAFWWGLGRSFTVPLASKSKPPSDNDDFLKEPKKKCSKKVDNEYWEVVLELVRPHVKTLKSVEDPLSTVAAGQTKT